MARRDPRDFGRDDANVHMLIIGAILIVAVPLVLFWLLFRYLRQTAPEGTVRVATPTMEVPKAEPGRVPGSRKCTRCGVDVKPQHGRGASICPNCGSFLAS